MKTIIAIGLVSCLFAPQSEVSRRSSTQEAFLKTSNGMESLTSTTPFALSDRLSITLEPGIRATRSGDLLLLETHDKSPLSFNSGGSSYTSPSPVRARLLNDTIAFDGGLMESASGLVVARTSQDDTDSNLKSMQESAKKLKSKNNGNQDTSADKRKLKVRWLFGENPMPTAELFNTPAIQQLTHLSPVGF